ncbi:MAG TPA: hypothetical protein VIL35_12170 [Vicinamibacterales bacterium]
MAPAPPAGTAGSSAAAIQHLLDTTLTQDGRTLAALARPGPLLLVFLRHFG